MAGNRILAAVTVGLLTTLFLAPYRAKAGTPGSEESSSAPATFNLSHARELLSVGKTAEAERLLRPALAAAPNDALLCLSGEIHFRRANFAQASSAFSAALELNPGNARAHWGLGRIDQLHFRPDNARDHFARAFALNHRDTDIILSYADYVEDPAARSTLLRNIAILARRDQPERAQRAVAQLRVLERLQGRAAARLSSPYRVYRLPLTDFRPAGSGQNGVLVSVRIGDSKTGGKAGSKTLRLLLDTGARGLLIDSHSAKNLDLETIVASSLSGFGDTGSGGSRLALAGRVSFGDLAFDECLVEVSDHSLTNGADGLMGIDIFERFQIHLNPAARWLELTPFAGARSSEPTALSTNSIPALGLGKLLLVNTRLEGGQEGLFLVDTGAAFTTVARRLVPTAIHQGRPVDLLGAQGPVSGAVSVGPMWIQVGGTSIVDTAPLAMDLRQVSQIEGVEISGILGYSVLGKSSLKIDLRNGMVEFAKAP